MSLLPPWTAWGWNVESRQARCAQTKQWLSRFSRSTALAVGWPTADRNVRYDCSRYRETDNAEQDRKMHCTWAEGKRLRWSPARRSGTLSAHVFSRFRLRIRVGLDGERTFSPRYPISLESLLLFSALRYTIDLGSARVEMAHLCSRRSWRKKTGYDDIFPTVVALVAYRVRTTLFLGMCTSSREIILLKVLTKPSYLCKLLLKMLLVTRTSSTSKKACAWYHALVASARRHMSRPL